MCLDASSTLAISTTKNSHTGLFFCFATCFRLRGLVHARKRPHKRCLQLAFRWVRDCSLCHLHHLSKNKAYGLCFFCKKHAVFNLLLSFPKNFDKSTSRKLAFLNYHIKFYYHLFAVFCLNHHFCFLVYHFANYLQQNIFDNFHFQ